MVVVGHSQKEAEIIGDHLIDCELRGISFGGLPRALSVIERIQATTWPRHELDWPRLARGALGVAGPIALLGLLALAVLMPGDTAVVFRGGLVVSALLTALVISENDHLALAYFSDRLLHAGNASLLGGGGGRHGKNRV